MDVTSNRRPLQSSTITKQHSEVGTYHNEDPVVLQDLVQGFWNIPSSKEAYQQGHADLVDVFITAVLLVTQSHQRTHFVEKSALCS